MKKEVVLTTVIMFDTCSTNMEVISTSIVDNDYNALRSVHLLRTLEVFENLLSDHDYCNEEFTVIKEQTEDELSTSIQSDSCSEMYIIYSNITTADIN